MKSSYRVIEKYNDGESGEVWRGALAAKSLHMQITLPQITPGDWNLLKARTLLHVETDADNPIGGGIPICSIPKSRDGTGEANAQAIYAIPSMLSALLIAYAALRDGEDRERALSVIRSALVEAGATIS